MKIPHCSVHTFTVQIGMIRYFLLVRNTRYINKLYHSLITLFLGTALGELVVWRKNKSEAEIIYRNFSHNGVIFSIDYNEKFLITSSDDRSIKVFQVIYEQDSFELKEIHQLFGHTSRVFVCKIINHREHVKFVSAGEDSNLCLWNADGSLMTKKNVSSSGIIWNLDYDAVGEKIITTSSSGKLNEFNLGEILNESFRQDDFMTQNEIQPAKLRYLKNGTLVVLDNKMEIFTAGAPHNSWDKVCQPKNKIKFVAVEVLGNRLFLAAKDSIVVYDYCEGNKMLKFTTEVAINDLISCSSIIEYLRAIHPVTHNEVFISDAVGSCLVVNVETRKILNLFKIPKSSEPWTTAVAQIDDYWLVADRVGNLFMYKTSNDVNKFSEPIQKLWKLHGNFGITTIRIFSDGFFKTTGNDGTLKTLRFMKSPEPFIELYECKRVRVNWIEKVHQWNDKEILLGFNDNYFVLQCDEDIIYEHRCGGRHRHWDVSFDENKNLVHFTYIQKKRLKFLQFQLSAFNIDNDIESWHVKECNCVAFINGVNTKYLISGGEDTFLILSQLTESEGNVRIHKNRKIHTHISSIIAITTWTNGEDVWIFSAGGRAQIVVTRLLQMNIVKEEVNYLLPKKSTTGSSTSSDAETRFTSLFYDSKNCELYVACSDGHLRIFKFVHKDVCELILMKEHFYGRCILQVWKIEEFIITMATDGLVNFWKCDETYHLHNIAKLKHNQSGINCFDIHFNGISYQIGTSGDDGAIFVTEFRINNGKIEFQKTVNTKLIHSSQVTGFKFVNENEFLTASIDQTICKLQMNGLSIQMQDKKYTCISDIKGMLIIFCDTILVHGAGLEILKNF